jgi:hypothetical protein
MSYRILKWNTRQKAAKRAAKRIAETAAARLDL